MKPVPVVIGLLFVGVLLLAISVFTRGWVTSGEDDVSFGIGLRDAKACHKDDCETFSYTKLIKDSHRGRDVAMAVTGLATFSWGIIAMIIGAITGILYVTRNPKNVLAVLSIVFASIALVCSFAFIGSMDKPPHASFSYSMFLFYVGYICMLIGSIMSMQKRGMRAAAGQPPMGYPGQQPGYPPQQGYQQGYPNQSGGMAPQAGPNCQSCGRPSTFVQQYQRYFCTTCNRYL